MTDAKTAESVKWLNQYCRKHHLPNNDPPVHQILEQAIGDYLKEYGDRVPEELEREHGKIMQALS